MLKDTDICNFGDDTASHVCDININKICICLELDSGLESNYIKLNTDKFYPIISKNKLGILLVNEGNDRTWKSNGVNLLGVHRKRQRKRFKI